MLNARVNSALEIDPLDGESLLNHVSALAYNIGPRPAGHEAEARARTYIRKALHDIGIDEVKSQPFQTPDTWGYALGTPFALSIGGLLLGRLGWLGRAAGTLLGAGAAYLTWRAASGLRQPLARVGPQRASANLIVRIPCTGRYRRTVVLLGHTDTNRHRDTFSDARKATLPAATTAVIGLQAAGAVAQAAGARWLGRAIGAAQVAGLGAIIADESGRYVDGANDNASAVACLLGIGAALSAQPLEHTDVWLVFTGAEETGLLGTHALLDEYGDLLRSAYFLDFEMVGRGDLAYVSRHSGFSYLSSYAPDSESVALVERTAHANRSFGVYGKELMILEEVAALRRRGHRGICLVGIDRDGWPANWHRDSDAIGNIQPEALERAARFSMAMLQTLDGEDSYR
ncbi:Zn-dependent exopeptidase M28 [Oscillochloris sp. ZM17-4]|uniref:M28 family peptidase n=1 Tax=Oscillochloris sp. ZM17-4 TaxID=2866714 RepID=UPI001C72F5A8|nr:M28 family peptidase [Oscillochloris sp. ZM17-4]MBX0327319.1 Zn-dependent exopeptidase M28 [Oscillochloris sp. ZM17-4]